MTDAANREDLYEQPKPSRPAPQRIPVRRQMRCSSGKWATRSSCRRARRSWSSYLAPAGGVGRVLGGCGGSAGARTRALMPRFMLDTDTCSFILKRVERGGADDDYRQFRSTMYAFPSLRNRNCCSGLKLSPRRHQDSIAVDAFLRHVAVLDFPDEAATHYAEIRADLKIRGEMIGANDLFIAAHARCLGLILVTNNMREFGQVRGTGHRKLDDLIRKVEISDGPNDHSRTKRRRKLSSNATSAGCR